MIVLYFTGVGLHSIKNKITILFFIVIIILSGCEPNNNKQLLINELKLIMTTDSSYCNNKILILSYSECESCLMEKIDRIKLSNDKFDAFIYVPKEIHGISINSISYIKKNKSIRWHKFNNLKVMILLSELSNIPHTPYIINFDKNCEITHIETF